MEYMILLTLVMAGIIIAGPYVVRSWNANLKGWEDTALDSLMDPLLQGDPGITPIGGCEPATDWTEGVCEGGRNDPCSGGSINCRVTDRLWARTWSPLNCQCSWQPKPTSIECRPDDCCCTDLVETGRCGINADGVGDDISCGVFDPPVTPIPKNSDGTCPDDMMEVYTYCGDNPDRLYGCIPHDDCIFSCNEPAPLKTGPAYKGLCEDSSGVMDDERLSGDGNWSYVAYDACTDPVKCERECAEDAFVFGTGIGSSCGPCLDEDIGIDKGTACGPDEYDRQGCDVGEYKQCCDVVPPPPLPITVPCTQCQDGLGGPWGVRCPGTGHDGCTPVSGCDTTSCALNCLHASTIGCGTIIGGMGCGGGNYWIVHATDPSGPNCTLTYTP